jgi:hypothetical protein
MLTPIRERRQEAEGKKKELLEIVLENNKKVRNEAQKVVDSMKAAMKISFS